MREPNTLGPTRAGRNLCAILDEMEARGERLPPYYQSRLLAFFLRAKLLSEAEIDPDLRRFVSRLVFNHFAEFLGKDTVPRKLRTHALSIAKARIRKINGDARPKANEEE